MKNKYQKKVCFWGKYPENYSRIRTLRNGFEDNGWEVLTINTDKSGIGMHFDLLKQLFKIFGECDIYYCMYTAHPRKFVAWLQIFLIGKIRIYDAFISLFDTMVEDRKLTSRHGFKAFFYKFFDYFACVLADIVTFDTQEDLEYFKDNYHLKNELVTILLGADDRAFSASSAQNATGKDNFLVHFHGNYIPLQGVEYIIRAAKLLDKFSDIEFRLIGSGQTYGEARRLAEELHSDNIEFLPKVSYVELVSFIKDSDICLGIFGSSDKTGRVIPNKVYEALAGGKVIITAQTPAVERHLINYKDVVFCKPADPGDLANKILHLYNSRHLIEEIGRNARDKFLKDLVPRVTIKPLLDMLDYKTPG